MYDIVFFTKIDSMLDDNDEKDEDKKENEVEVEKHHGFIQQTVILSYVIQIRARSIS
jgi:hypothetical protein